MGDSKNIPLLLLDSQTLSYVLGNGEFRFTNLKFDEAKAIIEMNGLENVVRCYINPEIDMALRNYVKVEETAFPYQETHEIMVGQDAIAIKFYVTASGTQPIILGDEGQQAKKIRNVYVYCQHVIRLK
ncbi:MAG: hypothetical protein KH366_00345 [Clostridiaceae bacterium]|nr:hypothetical protein [Clostridiaceae bacterium]